MKTFANKKDPLVKWASSLHLKELRSFISRIIRLWSLICSIRVYVSLHFRQILLEN